VNKAALLAGALGGAAGALPAIAAEWSATPSIVWTVDHQSNRDLRPEGQETQGAFLNVDVQLKRETGVSEISLRPRAQFQRYSDDSVADSTNASLAFAGAWRDELDSMALQAVVSRENALTSELEDTGFLRGDTIRNMRAGSASWDRELSERRVRRIEMSYAQLDYSGEYERALPGYRYPSLSISERLQLSGRSALSITAFGSELSDTRNYGAQFSLERQLTPRFFALAALGFNQTDLGIQKQDGFVAQLSLKREMELGEWSLDYSHSVAASGLGVLVERDRASFVLQRALAPRLRGRFELRSVRNDDLGVRLSGERHRFDTAEAGLDWRTAHTWTLGWRVGAARGDQAFGGESGEGWRTSLVAWWSPRPWTMSR
jgi:hypothetical protein